MSSKGSVPKRSSAGETPVVDSMWRRTVVSEENSNSCFQGRGQRGVFSELFA